MNQKTPRNIVYAIFLIIAVAAFVYSAQYAMGRQEIHTCLKLQAQYKEAPFSYSAWEATNQQRAKLDEDMCNYHGIDIHDTFSN